MITLSLIMVVEGQITRFSTMGFGLRWTDLREIAIAAVPLVLALLSSKLMARREEDSVPAQSDNNIQAVV